MGLAAAFLWLYWDHIKRLTVFWQQPDWSHDIHRCFAYRFTARGDAATSRLIRRRGIMVFRWSRTSRLFSPRSTRLSRSPVP
jgi:hypothetical protein